MHSFIAQRVMSMCVTFSIFLNGTGIHNYIQPVEIAIPTETIENIVEEAIDEPIEIDIPEETVEERVEEKDESTADISESTKPVEPDIPETKPTYYVDIVDGYITEDSLRSICEYVGDMYDVSPELLQAVAWVESRYEVRATSKLNAKGLCQVIERHHKSRIERLEVSDIYDPYSSVLLCADILVDYSRYKHGDDIRYVLMAYNMGPSGARKPYESGKISTYATMVLDKMEEFQK